MKRWLALLALAACTDVRQIVLSIDTTAGIPCDIDAVRIRATSAAATTAFERSLRGARLPLAVTLLDDTPDGAFALEVVGVKGDVEVMSAAGALQFGASDLTVPVVLEPRCAPGAPPCALSDPEATVTARYQCGPDVARYGARTTLETFQDACSASGPYTGKVLTDGSRGPVGLELGAVLPDLGFQFFGRPVHQIWVHRDGYISFSRDRPDPGGNLEPGPLDRDFARAGPPPPPRSVFAFWDRLSLRVPVGVCYDFRGDSGTHVLRLTWQHACLTEACTTDNLNFTITLDQASQTVMLAYGDMLAGSGDRARGATATVGLVGDAVRCAASECSSDGLCADGVTPCGYTQLFSRTIQAAGVQNVLFAPIVDPE